MQSLYLYTSCLFSMLLNEDIIDIEKPEGICSLTLVAHKFSVSFLHPSILSIIHWISTQIVNDALSDCWHWLNSYILVSGKGAIILQKP